ncbi:LysR substrate-binding domain-containing protein [Kitasatospora sp. NPDC001683]
MRLTRVGEAVLPHARAALAAHGLGVAVLPAPGPAAGLPVRRLTDPVPRVRIALAWPTGRPPAPPTAALLAHLRNAYPGPRRGGYPAAAAPSARCSSAAAPSRVSRSSGK